MSIFGNPFQRGLAAMQDSLVQGDLAARNKFISTFTIGTFDTSVQVAENLASGIAQFLVTKIPYIGPVIGLKMAWDSSKELWNRGEKFSAVKNFIPMVLGLGGIKLAVAASFTLNTIDAGVAIKTGDPAVIANALQGFAFDIMDARRGNMSFASIRQGFMERSPRGLAVLKERVEAGYKIAKTEWAGIKSDFKQTIGYVNFAKRQQQALKSGGVPLFDLNFPTVPQYKSSAFRTGADLRASSVNFVTKAMGREHSVATTADLRDAVRQSIALVYPLSQRAIAHAETIKRNKDNPGKGPSHLTEDVIRTQQDLLFGGAMYEALAPRLVGGEARAAGIEYVTATQAKQERLQDVARLKHNANTNPNYRRGVEKLMDRVLDKEGMTLTSVGREALIESFAVMNQGVLIPDPTGRASTIWKSIHAGKIEEQMPDVAKRLEAFEYGERYSTKESTRRAMKETQFSIDRGVHNELDLKRLYHQRKVLTEHYNSFKGRDKALSTLAQFNPQLEKLLRDRDPHISSAELGYMTQQLSALNNLVNKHQYSMPGPWQHLTKRLGEVERSANPAAEFLSILDTPFVSKETLTHLASIMQAMNNGEIPLKTIKKGAVSSILLRGTAGATLSQINTRAQFVYSAFSGDLVQMRQQLSAPDYAWRTISDIYKSPMQDLSDFDLNIVVRGGKSALALAHSKNMVKFRAGHKGKPIPGGEFIQSVIDNAPEGSELKLTALNEKIDDPFEIYIQDREEFSNFVDTQSLLNGRVFKGAVGVAMMPDGSIRTVVSPSQLFDKPASTRWSSVR